MRGKISSVYHQTNLCFSFHKIIKTSLPMVVDLFNEIDINRIKLYIKKKTIQQV